MDRIRTKSTAMDGVEENDPNLLPFLRAPDDAESESWLARLISEQTESTIKGIIRSKLRVSLSATDGSYSNQEALDLLAEVHTALLAGLRQLKTDATEKTIANLQSYVAAVTFNACHRLLRRKYPKRWQLKNKLRYLLKREPNFTLWESDEREWLCGLTSWCGGRRIAGTDSRQGELRDQRERFSRSVRAAPQREVLIELLTSVFQRVGGPILLDEVVTLAGELLGIREDITRGHETGELRAPELSTGHTGSAAALTELERRAQLQRLWTEICQLPLRHRAALLLNLRDKSRGDALTLLPLARVATIRQIAEVLDFSPEDFASVWNELPWDDTTIAAHLKLTRQQVINLRQSARARLARRLKEF